MSTEQVCIGKLRRYFVLDTSDIERMIDAVGAFDRLGFSDFPRVDPSDLESKSNGRWPSKPRKKRDWEWVGTEEDGKTCCIDSEEAKEIAELFEWRSNESGKKGKTPATLVRNLSLEYERVLGENHSSVSEDPTIYSMFLDVLSVNRDDAFRYIASKPFESFHLNRDMLSLRNFVHIIF